MSASVSVSVSGVWCVSECISVLCVRRVLRVCCRERENEKER